MIRALAVTLVEAEFSTAVQNFATWEKLALANFPAGKVGIVVALAAIALVALAAQGLIE